MLASNSSNSPPKKRSENPSGHKRSRSSLSTTPRLYSSLSCPHLPLLLGEASSSPPAVTPELAFGSTTPTREIFSSFTIKRPRTRDTDGPRTAGIESVMASEFPWDAPASTGRMSPAAELAGSIARRHSQTSPPPFTHTRSDPAGITEHRVANKNTLRLKLPPHRLTDGLEVPVLDGTETATQRSLPFGVAYPTTPDTGLHSVSVMGGERGHDGDTVHVGRSAVVGGGAAQQLLLAANQQIVKGGIALLTPPDDTGVLNWSPGEVEVHKAAQTMLSPTEEPLAGGSTVREPPRMEGHERLRMEPSEPVAEASQSHPLHQGSGLEVTRMETPTASDRTNSGQEVDVPGWIENAITAIVSADVWVARGTEAIRLLSYTLPCPVAALEPDSADNVPSSARLPASAASAPAVARAAGELMSPGMESRCISPETLASRRHADAGITTALHDLTSSLQRKFATEDSLGSLYIHINHAINPEIPPNRLPSTPPATSVSSAGNTPGSIGGDGYFAPRVFNSMVVVANSPMADNAQHPPLLPSPNPILPPSSLHLTLLERYIPPSSSAEDSNMFSMKSSILLDRLFELSPVSGSLLLIYPTKTGAKTFDKDYLGPVLDPLLRKLMVLYSFRDDLCWTVRNAPATPKMSEYKGLADKVKRFCRQLTEGRGDLPRTPVRVAYEERVEVRLNESAWREWWTNQEQNRIREAVKKHQARLPAQLEPAQSSSSAASRGETNQNKSFSAGYGIPGDVAREILDGVRAPAARPSSRGMGDAVLASSMSGTGSVGPGGNTSGTACIGTGGRAKYFSPPRRKIEYGVFVLRRGVE